MVGIEPSSRALIVEGRGWFEAQCVADISPFLTQIPLHMDVLYRNPVYLMVGGRVNGKCDMTLGRPVYSCKARATPPKEASFASEVSSREASTRMAVTVIARLKFSAAVDVLDWQALLT